MLRTLLLAVAILAVLALAASPDGRSWRPFGSVSVARPNVVLVVADDMRFDGLWVMSAVQAMASRGVTFSRYFVTTPLCCPSRATMLTGRYAHTHGVLANKPPRGGVEAFDDSASLAVWLQAAGVRTGLVGKYLNGYASEAVPPGWEFWYALWEPYGGEARPYFGYRVTDNGTRRFVGSAPDDYSTRVIGREALRFLQTERDRPFFLYVATRAPHTPATADPLDSGTFKELNFPLPPSYNEEDVSDKPAEIRGLRLLGDDRLEDLEVLRRRQFASLLAVDRVVASIVNALRDDGRLNQTWIMFTSDNGLTLGEHRRDAKKSCPYEECVRVPLVVAPPGSATTGRTADEVVANIDLAPTIAEIFELRPPASVDGRSLLQLLGEGAADWREAVVLEMYREDEESNAFLGIRTAAHKYVRYPSREEELYDEQADPFELENLAGRPELSAEKARLAALLDAQLAARDVTVTPE